MFRVSLKKIPTTNIQLVDLICYQVFYTCMYIVILSQVVYQIIIFDKTLYDIHCIYLSKRFSVVILKGTSLIFSVARIFFRFGSCAIYERGLRFKESPTPFS